MFENNQDKHSSSQKQDQLCRLSEAFGAACFHSSPWKGGPVYTDTVTTACDLPPPASRQEHLLWKGQQSVQMNGRSEQIEQTSLCYLLAISKYIQWLPLGAIYNSQDMEAT